MSKKNKPAEKNKINKKQIIFIIVIIIFIISISYIAYYCYTKHQNRKVLYALQDYTPQLQKTTDTFIETENMLKVKEFQDINPDVVGWITINDTIVDYPILQNEDNEYYLKHDYNQDYNKYGSIYIKTDCDINNPNSNLIIYGHNMKDKYMFNCLLQYEDRDFYNEHKVVNITTDKEEREYKIISVFKSRIFYQNEKNVFRFYNYLNFENSDEYNEYMKNVKNIELYDTGITATFGEQLITLVTCEYSQKNGRMVVVAKRIR